MNLRSEVQNYLIKALGIEHPAMQLWPVCTLASLPSSVTRAMLSAAPVMFALELAHFSFS